MFDNELMNFWRIELEVYERIVQDYREGFTPEFQEQTILMIRKIILNTECGLLHTED